MKNILISDIILTVIAVILMIVIGGWINQPPTPEAWVSISTGVCQWHTEGHTTVCPDGWLDMKYYLVHTK